MKNYKTVFGLLIALGVLTWATPTIHSQEESASSTGQVPLVVTIETVRGDAEVPILQQGDVKVKQGKNFFKVTQLIPAKGDSAALQLFVLIDDTLDSVIGNNLNDIRGFIPQPASTAIAIGYMSNVIAATEAVEQCKFHYPGPDHNLMKSI
jgi:hypothetical protein